MAPGDVTAGQALRVSGSGFAPGDYDIVLHSTPVTLGTVAVGAGGALAATVTIPAATDPGAHTLLIEQGGSVVASVALTVSAAGGLAVTGTNPAPLAALALGLALLGASVLVIGAGRRRRAA